MSIEIRYCRSCGIDTRHDIVCNSSKTERILIGAITFGFNELFTEHRYVCQRCGKETIKG